jgi:hypothetical protein
MRARTLAPNDDSANRSPSREQSLVRERRGLTPTLARHTISTTASATAYAINLADIQPDTGEEDLVVEAMPFEEYKVKSLPVAQTRRDAATAPRATSPRRTTQYGNDEASFTSISTPRSISRQQYLVETREITNIRPAVRSVIQRLARQRNLPIKDQDHQIYPLEELQLVLHDFWEEYRIHHPRGCRLTAQQQSDAEGKLRIWIGTYQNQRLPLKHFIAWLEGIFRHVIELKKSGA